MKRWNALCATVIATLVAACSGGPHDRDADAGPEAWLGGGELPSGSDLLGVGTHGLQVRQWRVAERPQVIAAALGRYALDPVFDEATAGRLARSGFRVVRLPASEIEPLLAELGGAVHDVDAWHGQVYQWRPLTTRPVDPAQPAVAVDGRVRSFGEGTLRLMMRGWTVPMEDGPHLLLEMYPDLDRSRPSRFDQMLRRHVFEGERFTTVAFDLLLDADSAYVLTCEAPGVAWGDDGPPRGPRDGGRPGPWPGPGVGPDVPAPPTIGEFLLRCPEPLPGRDVFVFVPRIPAALFPPHVDVAKGAP